MARARRAGVHLHTGDPGVKARTPVWGARDAAGSGVIDLDVPRRPAPALRRAAKCSWCGEPNAVTGSKPKRCKRCAKLERTIAAAERYLAAKGLRPLGESIDSGSSAEEQQRRTAAKACTTLNNVRRKPSKKKPSVVGAPPPAPHPSDGRGSGRRSEIASKGKSRGGKKPVRNMKNSELTEDRWLLSAVRLRIRDEQKQGFDRTASGQARIARFREIERELVRRVAIRD